MEDLVARLERFYAGRRVFVTGHTGFKGGWLWLWLERLGAEVTGYSLEPPSTPSLWTMVGDDADPRSLRGDVRDGGRLLAAVADARPEVVMHLAAQAIVRESYASPAATFDANVMGTVNVLEAVRHAHSVGAAIIVTSDKCYENTGGGPGYREDDRLGGRDPYSASKACAEIATAAYARSFFSAPGSPAVCTVRAGNAIGGGDFAADRLIPDLARELAAGRTPELRHPDSTRPWQFVLDPLAGYLDLAARAHAEPEAYAGCWNFGPDRAQAWPVGRVADLFCARWGGGAAWRRGGEDPARAEAAMLCLDSAKARERLGWRTLLDTAGAVGQCADWYRAHAEGRDPRRLCLDQIDAYMEAAHAL
ncbi:CDP-glucose 4,6-dehydratase [Pseudodesulfovibrio sp.]|uniref:CDP-glucose 4,6-dehydratase n=1 Tax=Pseudodesulfovibrio sp. TaxID=2035812 RepID=UPI0026048022|nr:CDP-glucose 4,6-dehydratase [Pseudodesulfovibrio sp.]MDD3312406.1 CDP-glucose 4,6-dehydratase [Pseudodesulfovibrio sp.]